MGIMYVLDERCEVALIRLAAQKHRIERYYNRRANLRHFNIGDLVLRKVTLNTQNQNEDYITHYLTGYNKLIALPNTNAKLVATCYNYGLLDTVYTQTGQEIATIPELYRAFMQYKRITKGTYSIYDFIQLQLTREMLIPERIEEQEEIEKINIPDFYANKRIIGISTILNELANNYLNLNVILIFVKVVK